MCVELVLTEQVQAWVARVAPQERGLREAAIDRALTTYAGGASVSEACQEARRFVRGRLRHPSCPRRGQKERLPAAS